MLTKNKGIFIYSCNKFDNIGFYGYWNPGRKAGIAGDAWMDDYWERMGRLIHGVHLQGK